jgi:hypothetical protein
MEQITMDYGKFLTLTGMELWNDLVSKIDPASLTNEFLDFAWQNKDVFDASQLEYVCWLLGESDIPHAERFLRQFLSYPKTHVRVPAIRGILKRKSLEPQTLEMALKSLLELSTANMGAGLLLDLFTPERESMLTPVMKEELQKMREYFRKIV